MNCNPSEKKVRNVFLEMENGGKEREGKDMFAIVDAHTCITVSLENKLAFISR